MRLRSLTTLLLCLGLGAQAAARELQAELDIQHLNGLLSPAELDTLLADPRLRIEAHYQPTRLIAGETARRERVMPLGSRLFAIPQQLTLQGDALQRQGRRLSWRTPDVPPGHEHYRLQSLRLNVPLARGPGRPQPELEITLMDEPPPPGGLVFARLSRHGAFNLGWRLRLRWSSGPEPQPEATLACPPDVLRLADGSYRYRPLHPVAGFFERLTPERPPGRLRQPLPADLAGWRWLDDSVARATVGAWQLERLRLYGEQQGPGQCRRTRLHEGLLANGRPVLLRQSHTADGCDSGDSSHSDSVTAQWLEDGSLASLLVGDARGSRSWDAFAALEPRCGIEAPPPPQGQRLGAELQRLRDAFTP